MIWEVELITFLFFENEGSQRHVFNILSNVIYQCHDSVYPLEKLSWEKRDNDNHSLVVTQFKLSLTKKKIVAETPKPSFKSTRLNSRPDKTKQTFEIFRADIFFIKLSELKMLRVVKIPAMIMIEQELGAFIPCVPGLRFWFSVWLPSSSFRITLIRNTRNHKNTFNQCKIK